MIKHQPHKFRQVISCGLDLLLIDDTQDSDAMNKHPEPPKKINHQKVNNIEIDDLITL